jgi:hypothetical protein
LQTEQLSRARESLVGAETSKVHLQERVDQLTRQLQGNEEKLAVYERRTAGPNGVAAATEQDLPREQQFEQEVAELRLVLMDCVFVYKMLNNFLFRRRSALKVAQVDLAAARSHMQQFQEISQANEAALTALNATHDQYKTETEAQIVKNEVRRTQAPPYDVFHVALHSWNTRPLKINCAALGRTCNSLPASSLNFNAPWNRSGRFGQTTKGPWRIPLST